MMTQTMKIMVTLKTACSIKLFEKKPPTLSSRSFHSHRRIVSLFA